MAPPFKVPPAVNYQSVPVGFPSFLFDTPPGTEGRLEIPLNINWNDYNPATAVAVDLTNAQAPQVISHITALWIDASQSDADVQVLFLDRGTSITMPARDQGLVQVSTGGLQFVVSSPGAAITDAINLIAYNYTPRTEQITPPYLLSASTFSAVVWTWPAAPSQLVAATVSGILTNFSPSAFGIIGAAGGPGTGAVEVVDGTNAILGNWNISQQANVGPSNYNLTPLVQPVRFRGGLQLQFGGSGTVWSAGFLNINMNFR